MKKEKLITLATIVFMVTLTIIAAKPSSSEIKLSVGPAPTPSPRTKRPKTVQPQKPTQPPTSQTTVAPRPSGVDISTPKLKTKRPPAGSKRQTPTRVGSTQEAGPTTSTPSTRFDSPKLDADSGLEFLAPAKKPASFKEGGVNDTTRVKQTRPPNQMIFTNDTIDKIELIKAPRKTPTASPCPSVTTNAKSPNSGRSSPKVMNKNCQEFEAVRPNSPQTPNAAQYNPKEVGIDKAVKEKVEKSPTSSGDQPELQINSTKNTRKVTKPKNQDIEVENDETHLTNNPAYREGGVNDTTHRNLTTPAAPTIFTNDTIEEMEVRKAPGKTPTARPSTRKVRKPKS